MWCYLWALESRQLLECQLSCHCRWLVYYRAVAVDLVTQQVAKFEAYEECLDLMALRGIQNDPCHCCCNRQLYESLPRKDWCFVSHQRPSTPRSCSIISLGLAFDRLKIIFTIFHVLTFKNVHTRRAEKSFSLTKYLIIRGLRNFEIQFRVFRLNVHCQVVLSEEAHGTADFFAWKRLHDIVVHRRRKIKTKKLLDFLHNKYFLKTKQNWAERDVTSWDELTSRRKKACFTTQNLKIGQKLFNTMKRRRSELMLARSLKNITDSHEIADSHKLTYFRESENDAKMRWELFFL